MFYWKRITSHILLTLNMCAFARIMLNGVKTKGHATIPKIPEISFAGEIGNNKK